MRPSFVRLVAWKEVRDLFRDRRTLMLVIILPALLYPLFVGAGWFMARSMLGQEVAVGVIGVEHLPAGPAADAKAFPPLVVDGVIPEEKRTDDPTAPPDSTPLTVVPLGAGAG